MHGFIFWPLYSFQLSICLCVSVFMPVPNYFDYCIFVIWFENREHDASCLFSSRLFRLFGVLCGSIQILELFVIFCKKNKNAIKFLIGIALKLQMALGSMPKHFNNINSSDHEHGKTFLCLQFLSTVSFSFQCTDLSSPWLNLFLSILLFQRLL